MNTETTNLELGSKDNDFLFFHSSMWGHAPFFTIFAWTLGIYPFLGTITIGWLIFFFLYKSTTLRIEGNSLVYNGFEGISTVQKEIAISDIKAIEVNYSLSQMIFGKRFGTLKIATAGTTGWEVQMNGVRHADELRKMWRNHK